MIRLFFVIFFIGNLVPSFAQQPAYFILGQEQFFGVHIYDVIQNRDGYYFATDEGVFYYDFYSYTKVECKEAKSTSMFNFVKNDKDEIFCNNLNFQIFKIKQGNCSLVYELNKNEQRQEISLAASKNGQLIIACQQLLILNSTGEVIHRFVQGSNYLGSHLELDKGNYLFHIGNTDSIVIFSENVFEKKELSYSTPDVLNFGVLKFFRLKNKIYAINLHNKNLFEFEPNSFEMKLLETSPDFAKSESLRIYEPKDAVWIAGTKPGVVYILNNIIKADYSVFYKDFFISDVYEDLEGNVLLSTFNNGVIVVPDLRIPDVINNFIDDPITSLYPDNVLGLILGSSKGVLQSQQDNQLTILDNNGTRPIEGIYSFPDADWILFDNGHIRAYEKSTKKIIDITEASLKDAIFVNANTAYLGTNRGILKCKKKWNGNYQIEQFSGINYRIYKMSYDNKLKIIYAATSQGLIRIDSLNNIQNLKYLDANIYAQSLHFSDGKLIAVTTNNVLLIIENNHVIKKINPKINGNPVELKKAIFFKNTIIASSLKELYQFDFNGKVLNTYHTAFGFSSQHIIDFELSKNILWVSHSGGVQMLNLETIPKNEPISIYLKRLFVNDKLTSWKSNSHFDSHQRKLVFEVSVSEMLNQDNMRYHYQLKGYDKQWYINDYNNNRIQFNALPPGSYTLVVKPEYEGKFGNKITYSFSISQPFYVMWWFIASYIIVFVLIVIGIYQRQLKIQQKKSRQLNELYMSKLTAIQSQMNPHFMFNSLNSIQDMVLKGDVENSYSYITTFSNLVRKTLNYSDKDFIEFEKEIELLKIYLSLEQLRFKKNMTFTINTQGIEDILIPPLLIQPFIENALVHGLLHKEGEKRLSINFELKERLICTIEDNGIGREKSKKIRQRQRSEHESFSGKAIKKRFEILSEVYQGEFGLVHEDMNKDGNPTGTKVILIIPFKRNY